ncbi:MAG: PQQ-binding-like beta-propeller repeat protein [Planctomycetia bacterium]|nr:MAG: PQQ-binding-like beta-propeller repeat protein [Planctomycetia bacterium]
MRLVPPLWVLCWLGPAVGWGQAVGPGEPPRQSAGAFLNTSFEIQEKLAAAVRLAESGRHAAAATALYELATQGGDYLIEEPDGVYVTIRQHVNRLMCTWPDAGLEALEETIGPAARERLSRARQSSSMAELLSVAADAFATLAGGEALDEAAERALAAGDLQAARRWWMELSAHHPSRRGSGLRWRAKAACAAVWSGDRAPLEALERELSMGGGPTVVWAGREQLLRDFLRGVQRELEGSAALSPEDDFNSTPGAFCGGSARRGASRTISRAEARLWRYSDRERLALDNAFEGYESSVARRDAVTRAVQSGRLLAACAVAGEAPPGSGRTLVFLHDATRVWSIDPNDPGREVWRYTLEGAESAGGAWMSDDDAPPQFTSLLQAGRLYVHLERPAAPREGESPGTLATLVCLNAATGKVIWRNDLNGLVGAFERLRLDGAPLQIDDKLYAIARRRKAFGFEACLLLRIDAASGALELATHIAEAATGSYGYHRATLTHAAAWGDLVFVATNLGAVAAVSRHTGRVVWLTTYTSQFTEAPEGLWPTRMGRPARSWHYQPPIVWRDSLIVSPLDADQIFVFDALSGREQFRLSLESAHLPEVILGVANDRLYLAGSQVVCYDLAARRIAWQRPLDSGQVFGRGAVTSEGLLIPTDRALVQMSLDGGPPRPYRWSVEDAGNVLVLPDQIVAASALSVCGLDSRASAMKRIAERMRERPDDAQPALAMAELSLAARDYETALRAAREAIARLGGPSGLRDEPARRGLYRQLTEYALIARSGVDAAEDEARRGWEASAALLELAGACATGPQEEIVNRFERAFVLRRLRKLREAVEEYQQVLNQPTLRRVRVELDANLLPPVAGNEPIGESEVPRQPAGFVAMRCIDRLRHEGGAAVYDSLEQRARDRLARAEQSSDAADLLEAADSFPNSTAAATALRTFARRAARQGDWNEAVDALRRSARRADAFERPGLCAELCDALREAGQAREAAQWLARGVRRFPTAQFEHRGATHTFASMMQAMFPKGPPREPAHDLATIAADASHQRVFGEHATILEPVFPRLPGTTWEGVALYTDGRLEYIHAATGRTIWRDAPVVAVQPALLGMDRERLIFATPQRLFAVARATGRVEWSIGEEARPDPRSDPEEIASYSMHALTPTRLFSADDHGELVAIDLADGGVRWRAAVRLPVGGQLTANETYVCHTSWQERSQAITVLEAASGRPVATLRPGDEWPIQSVQFTPRDTLLAVTSNAITCYDLPSGAAAWTLTSDERFLLGTLQVDSEGVLIGHDGGRITKYELRDGLPIWTSASLVESGGDPLWAELSDGRLVTASSNRLTVLDAADGQTLWSQTVNGLLRVDPPRVARDAVIAIVEAGAAEARAEYAAFGSLSDEPTTMPSDATARDRARSLRILAFDLESGQPRRTRIARKQGEASAGGVSIVTPPLLSFGGLYLRDGAFLVLDGRRILSYVDADSSR